MKAFTLPFALVSTVISFIITPPYVAIDLLRAAIELTLHPFCCYYFLEMTIFSEKNRFALNLFACYYWMKPGSIPYFLKVSHAFCFDYYPPSFCFIKYYAAPGTGNLLWI
jgi:hypothetical protein